MSSGTNITPGRGNTQWGCTGAYIEEMYLLGWQKRNLMIQAFSWYLWISCPCRYTGNSCSSKRGTSFLLLAQFIICIHSWRSKTKPPEPQNLPTIHTVWWRCILGCRQVRDFKLLTEYQQKSKMGIEIT